MWSAQLTSLHLRTQLLVKALRLFYAGLGLFAASALVSVGGSIVAYYGSPALFHAAALAIITGASAVLGLCAGSVLMVRETQLAVKFLEEEAKIQAAHHREPHPPG